MRKTILAAALLVLAAVATPRHAAADFSLYIDQPGFSFHAGAPGVYGPPVAVVPPPVVYGPPVYYGRPGKHYWKHWKKHHGHWGHGWDGDWDDDD
jgi:hypothetical protein